MRKILLAGAAVAAAVAAVAYMPTTAHAQAASSPVTVYIGGRVFAGVFFGHSSGQNDGASGDKLGNVNFPTYMRLYPTADYAAPNGIHYGINAEIRSNGTTGMRYGAPSNQLDWEHASAYVSSTAFGKLTFGTPTPVLETLQLGAQNDIGSGGFDGEFGWNGPSGGPMWLFTDNDETKTSINYYSPSFGGFSVAIGYMPYDNNSANDQNITSGPLGSAPSINRNKDRVDVAATYNGQFGAFGLKALVGYRFASVVRDTIPGDLRYHDMNMFDAGVEATFAGLSVGGHLDTGKFGGGGNVYEPEPSGAKSTTAFIVGAKYALPNPAMPLAFGGSYMHYTIDGSQYGLPVGTKVTADGGALGANYTLVPGVSFFLDALFAQQKASDGFALVGTRTKIDSTGLGIGTYFQW
jgi:predicted porin